MRSSSGKTAFDECCLRVERTLDTVMRYRSLPLAFRYNSHLLAVGSAAPDVAGDHTGERRRHTPSHRDIGTVDTAQHKVTRQRMMRCFRLGDDHQSTCVLVE